MAYLLLFFLIVLGYLIPRSRIVTLFQLVYIWVIIGLNTASPDFSNNEFMFRNIYSGLYDRYEPTYVLLMKLCHVIDLSFSQFRCIVAGVMVLFLWLTVRKAKTLPNAALSILMIYPVILFASGLRGAMAFGIAVYSIVSYLTLDSNKSTSRFVFGVLIATTIHYSYIIFLMVLFVKNKFKIEVLIRTVVIELFVMLGIRLGILFRIVSLFVHSDKVLRWLNTSTYAHPGIALDLIMTMLIIVVAYVIHRLNTYRAFSEPLNHLSKDYVENLIWLLIFFMPLLYLTVTFERYVAVIFSVLAVLLCNKPSRNGGGRTIWLLLALVLNVAFYYVIHGNIYLPIFDNNALL